MSDVKCPYCQHEQEICHDDGYGCEDSGEYEQWCSNCEKEFEYTTSISYHYNVYCADGKHKIEHSGYENLLECVNCDYHCLDKSGELNQQEVESNE